MLEKEEVDSSVFGARIKWRRLCAVLGCLGLLVQFKRSVSHNLSYTAWDDLNSLIASWIGSDAQIAHDSGSVLDPLVNQYAAARATKEICSFVGAGCFTIAMLLDLLGSSLAMRRPMRRSIPAIKFLDWARRLGFSGSSSGASAVFHFESWVVPEEGLSFTSSVLMGFLLNSFSQEAFSTLVAC